MTKLEASLGSSATKERLAQVVLVGRPNVGKTALFNALTYSRKAMVDAQPNLTRDRQEAVISCDEVKVTLVDCGGWVDHAKDVITKEITKQTTIAIQQADLLVMVVDALVGWQPSEKLLVRRLKAAKCPILLVVNKAEQWSKEHFYEFAALGLKEWCAVSALQRTGLKELRSKIAQLLPSRPVVAEEPVPVAAERSLVFLGCPNAGKSTLINRILGTSRLIAAGIPGTTRDSVTVPFSYQGKRYHLVDTAGIRPAAKLASRLETVSVLKAFSALKLANLVVLVLDAHAGPRDQDLRLINKVMREGKGLIIAVNKYDLIAPSDLAKLKEELAWRLAAFSTLPLVPISARTGLGLKALWRAINEAFKAKDSSVSTNRLNKILQSAAARHAAPLVNGKEVKFRYAHLINSSPIELVIHGARVTHLPAAYRRYLTGYFQQALHLEAFPIKLIFRSTHADTTRRPR